MDLVISVVGYGNIGKLIATLLLPKSDHNLQINIMDNDGVKQGAILDMRHGAILHPKNQIAYNSDELFNNSDFIFHCAGASVPKGKSRLITAQASIDITNSIFENFKPKKVPFIIVVSNPVEVISFITQRITGLPQQNIVGTGTFLDSIRMNYVIREIDKNINNVDAILLGEHGSTAFLSEQLSTINGQPFSNTFDRDRIDQLMDLVKASAEEIKATQDATMYGVSYCAIRLFETLLSPKVERYSVSTYLTNRLKTQISGTDLYLSLYSNISEKGIFPLENYQPNEHELACLKKSVDLIAPCIPKKFL